MACEQYNQIMKAVELVQADRAKGLYSVTCACCGRVIKCTKLTLNLAYQSIMEHQVSHKDSNLMNINYLMIQKI